MIKKYLGLILLLFGILLGSAAYAVVNPVDCVVNPGSNEALYLVDNTNLTIKIYDKDATNGWVNSGNTISLPAPCHGLAVSAGHLYVAVVNGSSSSVRDYPLDANGYPTGNFENMTGAGWLSVSAPGGMALNESQKRLFVTDRGVGRVKVFDIDPASSTYRQMVTEAGHSSTLSHVALSGNKVYVTDRAQTGHLLTFTYDYSQDKFTALTTKTGGNLVYPTYLKVAGTKLYVAVHDPSSANDILVYSTANESLLGIVSSGVSGRFGWTAYDLSPDGSMLYFKKAQNFAEDQNKFYRISTAQIQGGSTFTAEDSGITNISTCDGLAVASDQKYAALTDSGDGSVQILNLAPTNLEPSIDFNSMAQFNTDGSPLATGGVAKTDKIKVRFTVNDGNPADQLTAIVAWGITGVTPLNEWTEETFGPYNPGDVVEVTIPASSTFDNGKYDWCAKVTDQIYETDAYHFDVNPSNGDFIISDFRVTDTSPDDGATNVPLNAPIEVIFNRAASPESIDIQITGFSGSLTYTWSDGNTRVVATHEANFSPNTTYPVKVVAKDTDGNPVAPPEDEFSFTTSSDPSRLAPYIIETLPTDEAQDVYLDQDIEITFSRPIDPGSFMYTCTPNLSGVNAQWNPARDKVTLSHDNFGSQTSYEFNVTSATSNGIALIPGPAPNPFNFTTGTEISQFEIEYTIPADNDTGVSVNAPIVVKFNREVDVNAPFSLNIQGFTGTLNYSWSEGNTKLTATHEADHFSTGTTYIVIVSAQDTQANPLAGDTDFQFTTSSNPDDIAPYIIATEPTDEAQGVNLNQSVIITFSGSIEQSAFDYTCTPDPDPTGWSESWNNESTQVTLTHTDFAANTAYEVNITAEGTNGLPLIPGPAPNPFTFTTGTQSDTQAPALVTNFVAEDGFNGLVPLSWTNPADADLGEVIVLRKTTTFPADHNDGDLVYQDLNPTPQTQINTADTNVVNGTTYYYAVFSRDQTGNWNDTVTAGSNADTGTPSSSGQDPITSIEVTRDGDAPNSGITITWETNPPGIGMDVYQLIRTYDSGTETWDGFFTTEASEWTQIAINQTSPYQIPNSVGQGTQAYYKLIPSGATLLNTNLESNVVGKFDLPLKASLGYNLVSIPLVQVSGTDLDSVIGNQMTGTAFEFAADAVYYPNATGGFDIAWLKDDGHWYQAGSTTTPSTIEVDISKGMYMFINTGNSDKMVSVVGLVKTDETIQTVYQGYNLVGTPYPLDVALTDSGLFDSGLKAGNLEFSASALYSPKSDGTYDTAWLKTDGIWYDAGTQNPTSITLIPGKGYYIYDTDVSNPDPDFQWTYPRPY